MPGTTRVWLYRELLVQAEAVEELFTAFDVQLQMQGWLAMGGEMIDASVVPVSKQRNRREDNATV